MCGLFAIIPGAKANEFRDHLYTLGLFLAAYNVERGGHSYGMWDKSGRVIRKVGKANGDTNAKFTHDFIQSWSRGKGDWIAGHTRYATAGNVTEDNQHPFSHGNMMLAHNGMVDVEGYTEANHAVDSGRIAMALCEKGYDAGFKAITGTCGLLFSIDDKLYCYRSNQVLHISSGEWGWAISSSDVHLKASLLMAGLEFSVPVPVKEEHIYSAWEDGAVVCEKHATGGTGARTPRNYDGYPNYTQYGSRVNYSQPKSYSCDICGEQNGEHISSKFELPIKNLPPENRGTHMEATTLIYDVCNTCVDHFRFSKLYKYMRPGNHVSGYYESYVSKKVPAEETPEAYRNGRYGSYLKAAIKASKKRQGGTFPLLAQKEVDLFHMTTADIERYVEIACEWDSRVDGYVDTAFKNTSKKKTKDSKNDKPFTGMTINGVPHEIIDGKLVPAIPETPSGLFGISTLM